MITRFTGNRSTNLNFLLPKSFLNTYCLGFLLGGVKIKKPDKRKYILLFIGMILLLSCFTVNTQAEEKDIKIICSNSILADFTSNLIKENVSIEYIMPSGVCPAFYDTTPSDVNKIITADIIISLGSAKMEPWLSDLLLHNQDCVLIECKDMGEWNIPTGSKAYVEFLKDELSENIPEKNETIISNAGTYIDQIDEKSQELYDLIKNKGYQNRKVICMQWQQDFLQWLELNVTYSYGPLQGLSVQDELEVINTASSGEVYAIIDNLQSGTDFGASVASESGISHVIFTNFPGAIPGTDTYLDMITYNTEQLIEGFETYEYKQGSISELQNRISDLEIQRNASIVLALILVVTASILVIMYKKK
jgi:ABC-type Zn uptake system ZnuABC Zn-binding protein ZnuA